MPLDLLKRSEKTSAYNVAEWDGNLTAIENAVASLESSISSLTASIATINTTLAGKLANLIEDLTPELGGDLDAKLKRIWNVLHKMPAAKTASWTLDPNEGSLYNIQAASGITLTLPSSLATCPIGIGFEFHILNNIQVSFSVDNSSNLTNFSSHTKMIGPKGVAFLRVIGSNGSSPVYKLVGNTAA